MSRISTLSSLLLACLCSSVAAQTTIRVTDEPERIVIETPELQAAVRKQGYVSGVAAGSFLDRASGFRDAGFGLDIVDWIMEPGSDEAYRDQLADHMIYRFGNAYHGRRAKRMVEGPQICTKAGRLNPEVIRGDDFVAVRQQYRYQLAAPGRPTGSTWKQLLVFPAGRRYFLSSDRVELAAGGEALFLRIDMPGHIKHRRGDTFSEVYLSYPGEGRRIPAAEFFEDFAPDDRFGYRRDDNAEKTPQRFIRAYRLRDPGSGRNGPWLAGMTLDPSLVHEAWCHQRGYVCMIEEIGGRAVRAGDAISAAFIVGYFDSIEEMRQVYDAHRGHRGLTADSRGWKLIR